MLREDSWDDFGYKTTFNVEIHITRTEIREIGTTKIIALQQESGRTPMPKAVFETLGPEYCSLGQSSDYYEELLKCGRQVFEPFLRGLSDAVFDDRIKSRFEDSDGFKTSLTRFGAAEAALSECPSLFARHRPATQVGNAPTFTLKTRVSETAEPITVDFDFRPNEQLPNRVIALIGYNGTGKTQLLSRLAAAVSGFGLGNKAAHLANRVDRFVGTPPKFGHVVVVSYSAFDTFQIPGKNKSERERVDVKGEIFGYVYCGLREHETKAKHPWSYRLKTTDEIHADFAKAIGRINETSVRHEFMQALLPLIKDTSFNRIGLTQLTVDSETESFVELFASLSAGHKIVLNIVAQLTSFLRKSSRSLVIIDEPEAHLHPPLLASLLRSVRVCLDLFDAYAVIATHSPVVLQETPSRYVRILRRFGQRSDVEEPTIETFGENIGVLTQEVFNLDDQATDWHETLKELARTRSLSEIEEMFGRPLSFAARSFVLSLRKAAE